MFRLMYRDYSTLIIFMIPFAIMFVRSILALSVYIDAEKRGKNGLLWAILVLLFGIFVFIVWLIVRPPKQEKSTRNPANVYPQQPYAHMYEPPPESPPDKKE